MAGKTPAKRAASPRASKAPGAAAAASNVMPMNDRAAKVMQTVRLGDGLGNVLTSMGGGRRDADVWGFTPLNDAELMNAYRGDWIVKKACKLPADDMTAQWRRWQLEPDQIELIERAERKFGIRQKVKQALTWSRMLGGGALIIGAGNRDMSKPLKPEQIGEGGIRYVIAVPRTQLTIDGMLNWMPGADNYGLPELFDLNTGVGLPTKIHWSRVIMFKGSDIPDPVQTNDPWGDSIVQAINDAVKNAAIAMQSGARLVEEARVDVVMMENLQQHLGNPETEALLMQRLQLAAYGKSTFRTLLMGGGETYDSKQVNLANIDAVTLMFLQITAGAVDIPMTRFLGQAPAGLNATGESDMRNYASRIATDQENDLTPTLHKLDEMLLRHAGIDDPENDAWYLWNPIWTQSPKEAAETNKIQAEADTAYLNSGIIPTKPLGTAIKNRMIEGGQYPGFEEALNEATSAELNELRPEPAAIPVDPNKQLAIPAPGKMPKRDAAKGKARAKKKPTRKGR